MLSPVPLVPGYALGCELVQKFVVQRIGHWFARLYHQAGPKPGQHGRNPAEMVGMRVGDKRYRELAGVVTDEERHDHASPRIVMFSPGTGVDQHPVAGGCPEQRTVALPYVKKM